MKDLDNNVLDVRMEPIKEEGVQVFKNDLTICIQDNWSNLNKENSFDLKVSFIFFFKALVTTDYLGIIRGT